MRRARVRKEDSLPICRKCGSESFMAKNSERDKRKKHLMCNRCGTVQRYREPKAQ
jgi:ribosomal protein L37E